MRASIRALLDQIIDYAGLFPPAKLPLAAALETYLRERRAAPQRWMLGRFVCPAARLAELLALAKTHADRSLLKVTVLGQQASAGANLLTQLRSDLDAIESFRRAWSDDSAIDVYEVALPKGMTAAELQAQLPFVPELLSRARVTGYLEMPTGPDWNKELAGLAELLHEMHHEHPHGAPGLKLRCGGLTADAFPSDAQVAFFLVQCRDAHLPWKATAGLHHPRRHLDAALNVWHHGILNVFLAGMLGNIHFLSEAELVSILTDRELTALRCEEERIVYRDWSCTTPQIVEQRRHFATTFGSCSFAEPTEDLATLGLLAD